MSELAPTGENCLKCGAILVRERRPISGEALTGILLGMEVVVEIKLVIRCANSGCDYERPY